MRITIIGSGYVGLALARHWRREGQHQISLLEDQIAGTLAPGVWPARVIGMIG